MYRTTCFKYQSHGIGTIVLLPFKPGLKTVTALCVQGRHAVFESDTDSPLHQCSNTLQSLQFLPEISCLKHVAVQFKYASAGNKQGRRQALSKVLSGRQHLQQPLPTNSKLFCT